MLEPLVLLGQLVRLEMSVQRVRQVFQVRHQLFLAQLVLLEFKEMLAQLEFREMLAQLVLLEMLARLEPQACRA
jgi:hypothetical protein